MLLWQKVGKGRALLQKEKQWKGLFFPLFLLCVMGISTGFTILSCSVGALLIAAYTAKFGAKFTGWALPIALAYIFVFSKTTQAIFWLLYILPPFLIGCFIYFKGKFSGMLIGTTLLQTAVFTGHTLFVCRIQEKTPAALLFSDNMDAFFAAISASGQLEPGMLEEMKALLRFTAQTLQGMLPFLYLTASLFTIYLLFILVRILLQKVWKQEIKMPHFHELWLPKGISTIFAILFIISFFLNSPILSNLVSFIFMLHVFCGMSVIDFYLRAKGMSGGLRALLLAGILAFSSFLGGITTSILCCMGMSDSGRGIRK